MEEVGSRLRLMSNASRRGEVAESEAWTTFTATPTATIHSLTLSIQRHDSLTSIYLTMVLQNFTGGEPPPPQPPIDPKDHVTYMRLALDQAHESPPKPSNFRVGALLVDEETGAILSRGYTLELEGNTHAEQCCLMKFAQAHNVPEERVGEVLPPNAVIYTTMEPCNLRLSGNLPCVDRIIRTKGKDGSAGIKKVYLGVKEPEKFVGENQGRSKLEEHGIECIHIPGFEGDILRVATAGHEK